MYIIKFMPPDKEDKYKNPLIKSNIKRPMQAGYRNSSFRSGDRKGLEGTVTRFVRIHLDPINIE